MSHALTLTFALIFSLGSLALVWCVVRSALKQPVRNHYIDRPVDDERNWQASFTKSMKP
jgi:hypothetical protein